MSVIKTFEQRMNDAFGAAPQGFTAPISFKKLAKRAAREMESETFVIDGVDTAPALYTILVSSTDDAAMRPLYPQITGEISAFIEAQAIQRGYRFVGKPLARFMVDPSLHSGKFAIFAENIDGRTLERLRQEEEAFLSGSSTVGGAASAAPAPAPVRSGMTPRPTPVQPVAPMPASPSNIREIPVVDPVSIPEPSVPLSDDSMGLGVIPTDYANNQFADVYAQPQGAAPAVPATQRRPSPAPAPVSSPTPMPSAMTGSCILIDRQSGRTYTVQAPSGIIGRERTQGGVVLRDPNVSRRHAELTFDGRSWHISDLNSTNGTLVNDVDVDECALRDGDLITVGLMNLEFREN